MRNNMDRNTDDTTSLNRWKHGSTTMKKGSSQFDERTQKNGDFLPLNGRKIMAVERKRRNMKEKSAYGQAKK